MAKRVKRNSNCINCHFCDYFVQCPGNQGKSCIGCGSCIKGCPQGARTLVPAETNGSSVTIHVDGASLTVPAGITVNEALTLAGKPTHTADSCGSGSCYNCAVLVNNRLTKRCGTRVEDNMEINTDQLSIEQHRPLRLLSFFPNYLHAAVSVFTHGCNFNCDFCHNWDITFSSTGIPSTPEEAAFYTLQGMNNQAHPRVGISGGEPTLNRRWLIAYVNELKRQNKNIRIQLDTNASLLTEDYLDELVDAGVTDFSPDLKGLYPETFMKISGLENEILSRKYLNTAWQSVEYLVDKYAHKVFYHVAIPFHPHFISYDEVTDMGKKLAALDPNMNVNLIVYQPVFRMRKTPIVGNEEIDKAFNLLKDTGLNNLWCQEGDDIPQGVDPDELLLLGENF